MTENLLEAGMKLFSGIQARIILPFACVFLVVFGATALLTAIVVVRLQENIAQKQASDMARFVDEARLPLSRGLMERIESVTGKQVAFFDAASRSFSTTLDGLERPQLSAPQVTVQGTAWREFNAPMEPEGSRLYLLMKEEDLVRASRAAVRPVFLLAAAGAGITLIVGWLITKSITRPIRALAATAENVAPLEDGQAGERAPGVNEVAYLSDAFARMLARLEESQQKLVESERLAAAGRVITGVAHEIRNPLASMKMNAQMLQEQAPNDDGARLIISDIERLQFLIDELLSHGTPMRLHRQPVQLNDMLDDCLATLTARLRHAHVETARDFDAGLPVAAVDQARMKQVAVNLILNAMESMPGGGRLTVRTSRAGDGVAIEVEDTGCGIAAEAAPHVFDAFFSTREGGIGLGLAVCRRIIDEHGGRIDFESDSHGTVFRVVLERSEHERAGDG